MPCLQDVRVYQGADVCSDHHLSIAKIKIKLKRQKRKASMLERFDASKLKDSATEAQFESLLRNRLRFGRHSTRNTRMVGKTEGSNGSSW